MLQTLSDVIQDPVITVVASYRSLDGVTDTSQLPVQLHIGQVHFENQFRLRLWLPGGHAFKPGDLLTLHLDNRTGVDSYDAELKVYRTSYKGRVLRIKDREHLLVECRDFSLVHGMSEVLGHRETGYAFPQDARLVQDLPITPLTQMPELDPDQRDNKIGVLVTRTPEQPHTTVMAFLSTAEDDIFIISFPSTFKVQQLQRNPSCCFAIDERASFTFNQAIEWNYTLIDAKAHEVPLEHPLYEPIKSAFIAKNPWEVAFFDDPNVRLYHLQCQTSFCPARHKG